MANTEAAEIWALFRETDRRFQASERLLTEQLLETKQLIAEHAQETDRKFQASERLLTEKFQETDRLFKEHNRAAEQRSQALDKKIGELGNRLGEFAEGLIKPSVERLFQEWGLTVNAVANRLKASNPDLDLAMEIDLFVMNGNDCVLIEVKSHLTQDDVDEHLERMEKFKRLFPRYENNTVLGGVAGIVIADNVAKYAYRKGFFVITQKGDNAVILNDKGFKPKVW